METNPYPKTIIDESSGVEVSNNDYYIWDDGFKAGVREGMKEAYLLSQSRVLGISGFICDRSDMESGGSMGKVYGDYCKDCAEEYKNDLGAQEIGKEE